MTMRDRLIPLAALIGIAVATYALARAARVYADAHAHAIAVFLVAPFI
jgi:predicted lysophospholipase L1 biosynthesis ABC-type transport system permease subunit